MNKKLYRSNDNKMITGVCGGIAEYFGLDATWVRLGTVAVCLFCGAVIIAYIAASFIIPERTDNDIYDAGYKDVD